MDPANVLAKFVDFNAPIRFEDVPARNAFEYLRMVYNCKKLELLTYIFAADSMGLHSLIFT